MVGQYERAVPANTLHNFIVILWLYFGNLRELLSDTLMLQNLNYVRNFDVAVTLAHLT